MKNKSYTMESVWHHEVVVLLGFYVLALMSPVTHAGGFRVVPLKLHFTPDVTTSSVKLINEGDEKVTVQVEALAWSQDGDGQDQYASTEDLLFFPRIATVEPEAERVIRVGFRGSPAAEMEKTYRLYLQELPISRPGEVAMRFALRVGIPVFVHPSQEQTSWRIAASEVQKSAVYVRVTNAGNAHLMVGAIRANGRDAAEAELFTAEDQGWYVLAGQSRSFALPIEPQACRSVRSVNVAVTVADDTREHQAAIDAPDCARPEPGKDEPRRPAH